MPALRKPTPIKNIRNINLVKAEEIAKLREELREEILAEQAKAALKELRVTLKDEERSKMEPEFEQVTLTVDVPASADGIRIDGFLYHQGDTITVPAHQAASMREIMQNSWFAEKLAGNPNMKNYLPPKNIEMFAQGGGYRRL